MGSLRSWTRVADEHIGRSALTWDDAAIVRALLDGQPGSWDYFVERYAGLVAAIVRRILSGRGVRPAQADVDDLTENVFVMLLEKDGELLRRYDPSHKLSAYLGVLARTAVHRSLRRKRARSGGVAEDLAEGVPDDVGTISEEVTQREVLGAVRAGIETLSSREQRLLRLYYYEGLDYQALADELGVSINSIGAALSRARAKLAKNLREQTDLTESDFRGV